MHPIPYSLTFFVGMPMDFALATHKLTVVRGCILWLLPVSRRCSFIVCILLSCRGYALYWNDNRAGDRANGGMVSLVENTCKVQL